MELPFDPELEIRKLPPRRDIVDPSFPDRFVPASSSEMNEEKTLYAYNIYEFLEASLETYVQLVDFCLSGSRHIDGVVDIGCAAGPQSWLFRNNGLSYLGVESAQERFFEEDPGNGTILRYVKGTFPSDAALREPLREFGRENGPLCAVSVLCAFWIVRASVEEQVRFLTDPSLFDRSIVYVPEDVIPEMERYADTRVLLRDPRTAGTPRACFVELRA